MGKPTVLTTHPGVVDAAAYAVPSELGEHEVKLDVVAPDLVLDEFHGWLRENLPRYMVPRYLEVRPDLPRTPSQRVEKYKLAADGLRRPEVREYQPAFDGDRMVDSLTQVVHGPTGTPAARSTATQASLS